MTLADFNSILPIITVLLWALLLLIADLWIPQSRKGVTALLAALGLAAGIGLSLAQVGQSALTFKGMIMLDSFAVFLNIIYLFSGILAIGLSFDYLKRMGIERGEYYVLMMFSIAGMMLLSQAYNLIVVFLAIEFLSIPLYILAGFARPRLDSEEASLKYFLLGTFSSGFLLYGIALIFGATKTIALTGILASLNGGETNLTLFVAGAAMMLVGFGFKVAAVPFHEWAPDVYQGSPTPVSGFMAVSVKAAGFAVLLRIFLTAFPSLSAQLVPVVWGIAALTMIVGNLLAINQTNLKRLLAYSSIAHAGYLMMAFVSASNPQQTGSAVASMLYYLVAYGLTTFGAWAVVVSLEQAEGKGLELEDYAGVGQKYPWLGVAMLVFMLSLSGIPLTIGFWGKFFLFRTTVQAGFTELALIGLLTSLISVYYYLRVVVYMFMRSGEPRVRRDSWLSLVAVGAALAVVLLSVLPSRLLEIAAQAVLRLQ
ncbi:MAG TPA: NADH-quinone oxidoreductase subunit N [Bellilinea sp.]|nr:NADH-quinone oxidoreductase subunit N [Bellilinea sp.]